MQCNPFAGNPEEYAIPRPNTRSAQNLDCYSPIPNTTSDTLLPRCPEPGLCYHGTSSAGIVAGCDSSERSETDGASARPDLSKTLNVRGRDLLSRGPQAHAAMPHQRPPPNTPRAALSSLRNLRSVPEVDDPRPQLSQNPSLCLISQGCPRAIPSAGLGA